MLLLHSWYREAIKRITYAFLVLKHGTVIHPLKVEIFEKKDAPADTWVVFINFFFLGQTMCWGEYMKKEYLQTLIEDKR